MKQEKDQKEGREKREEEWEKNREKREEAFWSLQEHAIGIIQTQFPNSTEEEQDFQFQAIVIIEDDAKARMFLALLFHQRKCWVEKKIDNM